jgi:hypothetical protein
MVLDLLVNDPQETAEDAIMVGNVLVLVEVLSGSMILDLASIHLSTLPIFLRTEENTGTSSTPTSHRRTSGCKGKWRKV